MIVRSSSFSTFKTCPRKAFYKYEKGFVRKGQPSSDLGFGKSVHFGIETFHLTGSIQEAIKAAHSITYPVTAKKNSSTATALLHVYKAQNNISIVSPEIPFSFAIGRHIWRGKLDAIGQHISNHNYYVVEHKTTNPRALCVKPNDQFISYFIGSNKALAEGRLDIPEPVAGVLINNLDPDKIALHKLVVSFAQTEIDFWLEETEYWLDFYEKCQTSDFWPRNPNACSLYGRACSYHELCQNPAYDMSFATDLYDINQEAQNLSW